METHAEFAPQMSPWQLTILLKLESKGAPLVTRLSGGCWPLASAPSCAWGCCTLPVAPLQILLLVHKVHMAA